VALDAGIAIRVHGRGLHGGEVPEVRSPSVTVQAGFAGLTELGSAICAHETDVGEAKQTFESYRLSGLGHSF
jgi:hypothetical protein